MENQMTTGQLVRFSLSKLITEFFGVFMLTLFWFSGGMAIILSGLWILIVFGWKISGSHYNPAITLAYMFRRDGKAFPRPLGVAYIVAQILGGFAAALLLLFFTLNGINGMEVNFYCYECDPNDLNTCKHTWIRTNCGGVRFFTRTFWAQAMLQEILGTFIFVLFFMMMTDEKMLFSKEKAINCFIIASSYIAAIAIFNGERNAISAASSYGACLNPAIALGIYFGALCNGAYGWDAFTTIWIFPVMPLIGAVLSLLFYEFFYKRTQEVMASEQSAIISDSNHEDNPLLD
jgi:glycerol uptake facilitator-like aquaporin